MSRGSHRLSYWGLTCDGLVSCPGGSHRLSFWGLTCDGLVSCPGGLIYSHPLNTTETEDKRRPYEPLGSGKDLYLAFNLSVHSHILKSAQAQIFLVCTCAHNIGVRVRITF